MMKDGCIILKKNRDNHMYITASKTKVIKNYTSDGLEICKYFFKKHTVFYIDAVLSEDAIKTYYIISGKCKELKSKRILEQDDLLVLENLKEKISILFLEDTVLLMHAKLPNVLNIFKKENEITIKILENIQLKDNYTMEHSIRVFNKAKIVAIEMGYYGEKLYVLNKAARFHDVGKIFIDDYILNKPDKLLKIEFEKIKEHTTAGKDIIINAYGEYGERIFNIISQHHERIDGSGYPKKLSGDDILEEAKILAICDSYDAMTTDRVYKKGISHKEAIAEIIKLKGIKYDEKIVDIFVNCFKLNKFF